MIPFRARHALIIKPFMNLRLQHLCITAQDKSRAWTGCMLGDPIGAAGIKLGDDHAGEAWALFSPLIKRYPLFLFRELKTRIERVVAEEKLTRVWSVVDEDDPAAIRLIGRLGFEDTGLKLFEREIDG